MTAVIVGTVIVRRSYLEILGVSRISPFIRSTSSWPSILLSILIPPESSDRDSLAALEDRRPEGESQRVESGSL